MIDKATNNNVGDYGTLLTNGQVADIIGVSTKTLERWRGKNIGPRPLIKNKGSKSHIRYPKVEIEGWINASLSYGRPLHSFSINDFGVITGRTQDLTQDNVIVGPLYELLTEEQWYDSDVFRAVVEAFRQEQEDEMRAVNEAQAILDRRLLQAHCPPGVDPKPRGPL